MLLFFFFVDIELGLLFICFAILHFVTMFGFMHGFLVSNFVRILRLHVCFGKFIICYNG
jgi:hypothetical protein